MKYTKGKWEVYVSPCDLYIRSFKGTFKGTSYTIIAKINERLEDYEANAKLISKAPEMYEAINLYINGKKSKTMGYYSDDQMNAVDQMKSLLKEIDNGQS